MNNTLKKHCNPEFEKFWFSHEMKKLSDREERFIKRNRLRLLENATKTEIIIAEFLDEKNIDFFPQLPIHCEGIHTTYWADFFLPKGNIVLEIDGSSHCSMRARTRDLCRDAFMSDKGITVRRITNEEVESGEYKELLSDIAHGCASKIREHQKDDTHIPCEKMLRNELNILIKIIPGIEENSACFLTVDRHIINLMTNNIKPEHKLFNEVSQIKEKLCAKNVKAYWKYSSKNAKKWMGRHMNNHVTKLYIEACKTNAPEYKLW